MAAYDAQLPEGCSRTIYLCDDGKDPKKRKWVDSLAADVVYVSGRKRPAGRLRSFFCSLILFLYMLCATADKTFGLFSCVCCKACPGTKLFVVTEGPQLKVIVPTGCHSAAL